MVTSELTQPVAGRAHIGLSPFRPALICTAALVCVTAIAAAAGAADPALVPNTPPHPTLHPTFGAIASIFVNNARVLALPFLLVVFRFDRVRWGRAVGTILLAGILAGNAITVGITLGRWQGRLVPYLPHLPLEWTAAGVAAGVWAAAVTARRDQADHDRTALRGQVVAGVLTLVLLAAAAVTEVLLTPHAR
jgi:general stress protein CsbA